MWDNCNDLDLAVTEPVTNYKIWYAKDRATKSGGLLDIDRNAVACEDYSPVENI